ncbi:hypothetical protein CFI10_18900 [Marinobacterium iners]|jgi:hypothetical protein|uniref:hypothetical protein n=1 Tax=Marinobacterium iners TaxID=48076 RepID=UPI001A90B6C5|nr:hypothetical protein [Marinobacterium iners]QSR37010.1 hypothetical protein CFI10_18900 [Marinobacterium iners]
MDAYVVGNLLGRLLMSAAIVYLVLFVVGKFDFKFANKKLKSIGSILAIMILFLLGLATNHTG